MGRFFALGASWGFGFCLSGDFGDLVLQFEHGKIATAHYSSTPIALAKYVTSFRAYEEKSPIKPVVGHVISWP
jgi:hypothetical protein